MTGVERLQGISMAFGSYAWGASLSEVLGDIADQIKREHAEDCFRMGERAADVSMSAYDLLPADEREAIAWVREHGGLEHLKSSLSAFEMLAEGIEIDTGLAFYDESPKERCVALRNEVKSRLMPEGMEWLVEAWPKFEDDAPLCIGDEISWKDDGGKVNSIELQDGGYFILHAADGAEDWIHPQYFPGERVKRPASKVLDADGVEIREKGDVWWICEGDERGIHAERLRSPYNGGTWVSLEPSELYVNKPVPASDGRPLREGETVYHIANGVAYVVREVRKHSVVVEPKCGGRLADCSVDYLTHERPERKCRDCAHWQKDPTADSMGVCWFYYHEHEGQDCYAARRGDIGACEEFMPRGKALAGDA